MLEDEIKIYNINYINESTGNHFKNLNSNQQIKIVQKLVSDHLTIKNASFTAQVISPRAGSKYFEAHATIKFSSTVHKFEFKKNFSNYRRNNPGCKLFTSRPVPKPTHSDRDLPDISDIKTRIGMMYNQAVFLARHKNPNITFKELAENEIDAIQVTLKERDKHFKMYYEFLCTTNNTTFIPYTMNTNPFFEYDFSQHIPNPVTRKHARSYRSYEEHFHHLCTENNYPLGTHFITLFLYNYNVHLNMSGGPYLPPIIAQT